MTYAGDSSVLRGLTPAGTIGLLGLQCGLSAAEPPPETTTLKLCQGPEGVCIAPQYVAEALLQGEGFTEVQYVQLGRVQANQALASGEIDLVMGFVGNVIIQVDAGEPITLSGGHVGCFEPFAADYIRSIRDLKGKHVGVAEVGSGRHVFFASVLAYVDLDPRHDVHFVTAPAAESRRLFTEGKLDAYVPVDVEIQELRTQQVGHVLLNSALDRPWSQYFCCVAAGEPRVHSAVPDRHQAGAARDPESGECLRPRARPGGSIHRGEGLCTRLRLCPPDK